MKKLKIILIAVIAAILAYKVATNLDVIKHNFSWIFEGKEEEAALPELSNEEIEKANSQNEDLAKALDEKSEAEKEAPAEPVAPEPDATPINDSPATDISQ